MNYHVNMDNNLTCRELEVLKLAVLGYSNAKIGEKLFISIHTVKFHLENIYRKLKTHNKVQATIAALKNGILSV